MKAIVALLALLASLPAAAQAKHCIVDVRGSEVCGMHANQCMLDRYRAAWCASANGTAMKDRHDEVVCGAGACVRDSRGDIVCAGEPGGVTSLETSGKALCAGGCIPASRSACRAMTRN
jgi:hypothetical protein